MDGLQSGGVEVCYGGTSMRDDANQRDSRYPSWVCSDCGERHGRREPSNATWHEGECDVCGYTNAVTQPRDFGHLKDGWQDVQASST